MRWTRKKAEATVSDNHTEIAYPLALTRLQISGTAETEEMDPGRRGLVAATATVELRVAADPYDWLTLQLPDKAAADRAFTLKLTDDGRLSTTDFTATGRAGAGIKTLVSTVSTVAGVALGVLGKANLARVSLGPRWQTGSSRLVGGSPPRSSLLPGAARRCPKGSADCVGDGIQGRRDRCRCGRPEGGPLSHHRPPSGSR